MATVAQIERAIRNAEAANDTAAVSRLKTLLDGEIKKGAAPGEMTTGEVISGAVRNIPGSAYRLVGDYVTALTHPIDTAKAVGDAAAGGLRYAASQVLPEGVMQTLDNLGGAGENSQRAADTATAVGRFYKDRYGSLEGFKRSIAEDPVGVAADVSVPLTLGGSAAARAPGVAGRVGQIARAAGRVLDPVTAAAKVSGGVAKGARGWVGVMTGTGVEPLKEAFNAARAGGPKSQAFYDNMRGNVPIEDVVTEARNNLQTMSGRKAAKYQADIQSTKASTAPVNLKSVANQLMQAVDDMHTAGLWTGGAKAQRTADKLMNDLISWAQNPNALTPIGLDGLKKKVNNYYVTPGPGASNDLRQANRLVEIVYDALGNEIRRADPNYAKTMADYEKASAAERQLTTALSLGGNASIDTALRKLQSTMRNDVQTNYGQRTSIARDLDAAGKGTIMPALAGQALSAEMPRGVARAGLSAATGYGVTQMLSNPLFLVGGIANAALSSPRLVGEITGKLGEGMGLLDRTTAKIPKAVRDGAKANLTPLNRAITQETGGIANEADAMLIDAKGNVYDNKGRLIRRAGE